jgi:hypothetical protein
MMITPAYLQMADKFGFSANKEKERKELAMKLIAVIVFSRELFFILCTLMEARQDL